VEHDNLPATLIRCKPDWHAAEVIDPRKTDYYRSWKALGKLFRHIALDDPEPAFEGSDSKQSITDALRRQIRKFINPLAISSEVRQQIEERIFKKYCDELQYIALTHTVTSTPGSRLLEAEIVAGIILAKCSQNRWRKDRIYRMRLHSKTLVANVQNDLHMINPKRDLIGGKLIDSCIEKYKDGLRRCWVAWEVSNDPKYNRPFTTPIVGGPAVGGPTFGANSFAIIALGRILDCLQLLKGNEVYEESAPSAQVGEVPETVAGLFDGQENRPM
jgi:RNA-dependent RNA polymerase